MEARIARLESDVAHMRTDIAEIKVDLRGVRDKLDSRFDGLKDELVRAQIRMFLLYIAFAGAMLGVMARGFGWI
jgi:hypothetical protein